MLIYLCIQFPNVEITDRISIACLNLKYSISTKSNLFKHGQHQFDDITSSDEETDSDQHYVTLDKLKPPNDIVKEMKDRKEVIDNSNSTL